jgi:hypothetical protein
MMKSRGGAGTGGANGGQGPNERPPHPATMAQPKVPHPAMVAQGKGRPPHPATVAQPKVPHPAMVVQRKGLPPHPANGAVVQRMEKTTTFRAVRTTLDVGVGLVTQGTILYTDGLAGCVALALVSRKAAYLVHIFNRRDVEKVDTLLVKATNKALSNFEKYTGERPQMAVLVDASEELGSWAKLTVKRALLEQGLEDEDEIITVTGEGSIFAIEVGSTSFISSTAGSKSLFQNEKITNEEVLDYGLLEKDSNLYTSIGGLKGWIDVWDIPRY